MDISSKLKNAKFLIFDFDGTIADTSPIHEKAFKKVFEPFLLRIKYQEIAGKSTKDAIENILMKNNIVLPAKDIKDLIYEKQLIVRETLESQKVFNPLPFVKDFIKKAHKRYQMGIASSGSRSNIETALKKLKLYNYFNPILCSEDVKNSKPSPEIFLKIISLTNFTKEECLIFEDSKNGIQASKAANIPFFDINQYPFKIILEKFKDCYE